MIIVLYYPCSVHGHVALALTGLGAEKNIYISFYPDITNSKAQFRLHNLEQDGNNITSIAILPSEETSGYGLSEEAIFSWWQNEFKPNQEGYGLFNNNCSSIVYRALCAGQKASESLEHALVLAKSWFCETPWGIFDYAKKLGQSLFQNHHTEDPLYLQFAELKECVRLGQVAPYHQALAISIRIKTFNTDEFSLAINKVYCDSIKEMLARFTHTLAYASQIPLIKELETLASTRDIEEVNIDTHIDKLNAIANLLYGDHDHLSTLDHATILFAKQTFDHLIKIILLNNLNNYISQFDHHHLYQKERIQSTHNLLKSKIDDRNNPQADHFQFGGKVMPRLFSDLVPKLTLR